MKLIETEPFAEFAMLDKRIEEVNPDAEDTTNEDKRLSFEDARAFPWPGGRIPYDVMQGMKFKMVRRSIGSRRTECLNLDDSLAQDRVPDIIVRCSVKIDKS